MKKNQSKEETVLDNPVEAIISQIIDKNRLLQSAIQLHPKALPRASVVGRVAKELGDYVLQLEILWQGKT